MPAKSSFLTNGLGTIVNNGGSLTGVTLMVTVATLDWLVPSVAL